MLPKRIKPNPTQRDALERIAVLPLEARYDNGVTRYGAPKLVGTNIKGVSVQVANALARLGWISKGRRLPHFKEGMQVVDVYEITALGRSMLT